MVFGLFAKKKYEGESCYRINDKKISLDICISDLENKYGSLQDLDGKYVLTSKVHQNVYTVNQNHAEHGYKICLEIVDPKTGMADQAEVFSPLGKKRQQPTLEDLQKQKQQLDLLYEAINAKTTLVEVKRYG